MPPTNHLANGGFQSSTLSHGLNQCEGLRLSPQKPSGSSLARFQSAWYCSRLEMCALRGELGRGREDPGLVQDALDRSAAVFLGHGRGLRGLCVGRVKGRGLPATGDAACPRCRSVSSRTGKAAWILRPARAGVNFSGGARDLLSGAGMATRTQTRRKDPQGPVVDPIESAKVAGLRYVSDTKPGIRRKRSGKGFTYLGPDGKPIRDPDVLRRIASLAIPPAWTEVWISPKPLGHLQATGRDAKGRKQYRYHPRWRAVRDETKYSRMLAFGAALPADPQAHRGRPGPAGPPEGEGPRHGRPPARDHPDPRRQRGVCAARTARSA